MVLFPIMLKGVSMMHNNSLKRSIFLQYLSLILPGLMIFTFGLVIPLILGFKYSFTSWNGMTASKPFVGLQNYINLFKDKYVLDAWKFTIKFTLINTVVQNFFALLLAIALDGAIKAKKIYRTIFFLPALISSVIAGFIWLRMYSNILPAINKLLGTSINFLLFGNEKTVLSGLLIANNWQWIGYWMLIYLAALQSIPAELYEAAKIDGASVFDKFLHVTIPMLAPAFTICIVGITTGSLKVYELMVSSTGGGPGRASTSIIYLIYNTAINGRQYGYGCAMSVTLVAVLLLVAVIQLKFLRDKEVQM